MMASMGERPSQRLACQFQGQAHNFTTLAYSSLDTQISLFIADLQMYFLLLKLTRTEEWH